MRDMNTSPFVLYSGRGTLMIALLFPTSPCGLFLTLTSFGNDTDES